MISRLGVSHVRINGPVVAAVGSLVNFTVNILNNDEVIVVYSSLLCHILTGFTP